MKPVSLLNQGRYSADWVKDFYDQTGIWWGPGSEDPDEELERARTIDRLCGPGPKRILELGCGTGHTAAATANQGHNVTALDISTRRIQQARENNPSPRKGSLAFIEGDFYTVELEGKFDVICYWDGFGIGSDEDQRRLMRRMADEWLAADGHVLLDVTSGSWAARHAGEEFHLDPLEGVSGSVHMLRRWHFDVLHSRWIDEWIPTKHPEDALAQSIRCYTPADFLLLLEGTGLELKSIEANGLPVQLSADEVSTGGPLAEVYSYLVALVLARQE